MILIYVLTIICLLVAIWWLIPAFTQPIKDKRGRQVEGSITSLEKVTIGGKQQWILIRGVDVKNPVILFLHGGPGTAEMCLLRKYTDELEKHFVVVTWDQRGAGKSFAGIHPASAMTIDRFVADTHELTQILLHQFNQKKIYLRGHSWGSVIGVLTVQRYPDLYYAYIGIGQVADMYKGEQLSYEWTLEQAKKANDEGIVKKLTKLGTPPYTGDWQKKTIIERRYLAKYGGEIYGSSKGAALLVLGGLIRATEYSLQDKFNFFRGISGSMRLLWPQLMTINLMKQAPVLKVPVYFMTGRHDYEVPFVLAEQYFNILEAPVKELIWFENSAHFLNVEENDMFNNLLINHVLPATIEAEPVKSEHPTVAV